jgi:hypothetical protein
MRLNFVVLVCGTVFFGSSIAASAQTTDLEATELAISTGAYVSHARSCKSVEGELAIAESMRAVALRGVDPLSFVKFTEVQASIAVERKCDRQMLASWRELYGKALERYRGR